MDCIIRVINGPDQGREHRLVAGPNLIGRGNRAALRLTPEDVSWEHAVVTRDGTDYYLENLSALGTWVGDARITGRVRLRPRDKVRLTKDTVLRIDAAEGGGGLLSSRLFLGVLLVAMLGLLAGAIFYSSRSDAGTASADWARAYNVLMPWLRQQSTRRRIAPEAVDLFQTAWRLDQARDYKDAQLRWLRLQEILATAEPQLHSLALAEKEIGVTQDDRRSRMRALQKLLSPPTPNYEPSDEELPAAMAEFVERRLAWCRDQLGTGSVLNPS